MDIKTLCLGALSRSEASGYEIKRQVEESFGHFYHASYGSIYPALGRLTDDGLVTCESRSQEKRPDKKVYRITSKGRMALVNDLLEPPGPDRIRSEFLVAMLFFELLPLRHISEIIDRYLAANRAFLSDTAADESPDPGRHFVCGFGRAVHGAIIEYLENNRHIVEGAALEARLDETRKAGTDPESSAAAEFRRAGDRHA